MEKEHVATILSRFKNPHYRLTTMSRWGEEGFCLTEPGTDPTPLNLILLRNIRACFIDRGYLIVILTRGQVRFIHLQIKKNQIFLPESFFDKEENDNDRSTPVWIGGYELEQFEERQSYRHILLSYEYCFARHHPSLRFCCGDSRFDLCGRIYPFERIAGTGYSDRFLLVCIDSESLFFLPLHSCGKLKIVSL